MSDTASPQQQSTFVPVKAEYPPRIYVTKLRELREAHPDKPTIHTLANAIGVTPITMSRIEDGIDLRLSNALALCAIFGKRIDEIWEAKAI